MKYLNLRFCLVNRFFGPDGDADTTVLDKAADKSAAGAADKPKTFTQEDVNAIIDKRLGKIKTEKEQLLGQLQKLQEGANLTTQQKEELQGQIEGLQSSLQTKEQATATQIKTLETKYTKQVEGLTGERDTWRNRYTSETVRRSITDAAVAADAEDPSQLVLMFGGIARLDEEKDGEGKATGNFLPMLKFQGIDPTTKKPALMDMPINEAIAHMRENGLHKNLFKHGGKPGTGSGAGSSNKSGVDSSKMPQREDYPSDNEYNNAYQGWRDNYNIDGTPRKK